MKYKSLEDWNGSPDGCNVTAFKAGETYDHGELGDSLVNVGLREGWIEVVDEKQPKATDKPQVVEVTLEIVKDGMTVPEMHAALKDAGVKTSAKKEDTLAKLILKHGLFGG